MTASEYESFGPIGPRERGGPAIRLTRRGVRDREGRSTQPIGGTIENLQSIPNFRDVGGRRTQDGGRIRHGLLYRSGALDRLAEPDATALVRLGIATVFDLRTLDEQTSRPDRLPPGIVHVPLDVIGSYEPVAPSRIGAMFRTPSAAVEGLGNGRGEAIWMDQYRQFVLLEGARCAFGHLFAGLSREANRPALVHCTTGKDRTGWAAACLEMLLGVPDDVVMDDYLLSERLLAPFVGPLLDEFAAAGGDPDLLRPILGVDPRYLEAAISEVRRCFGSVEAYFADGLGVGAATQRALRHAFVEPG